MVENGGLSIGSRYVKGGSVEEWDTQRVLLSKGAALYVRLILQLPVLDPTAGFMCYHRKVLESIPLDKITWVGYGFQIAMKYYAYKLGFSIKEIPIAFIDRVAGKSKMSMAIFKEALLGVWQLRKIVFSLLAALSLFTSCHLLEYDPRKIALTPEKMAEILYDIQLFEEYAKAGFLKDTTFTEFQKNYRLIEEYQKIFEKHNIDKEAFEENFTYYGQEGYAMKSIYEFLLETTLKETAETNTPI